MDVFRFVKVTPKANDPARRYYVVSGSGERVGDVEVIPPKNATVAVAVLLRPTLSDAARQDALDTTRRFLDELALGWGVQLIEEPGADQASEQPDGNFLVRLEYRTI